MPQVMAAIDIFLFTPYWGEGLPYVVLEAMSTAKPVIASNVGSNRELVLDGQTGFLPYPLQWSFETDHLEAEPFAEKIEVLIKNKIMAQNMGIKGRNRIEKKFNIYTMVMELEKLYQNLINE